MYSSVTLPLRAHIGPEEECIAGKEQSVDEYSGTDHQLLGNQVIRRQVIFSTAEWSLITL